MRFRVLFIGFLLVLCLSSGVLQAQESRAVITGTVTDPQGAAVPGASVHVKNLATNVVTAFRPKVVYPYHYRDSSGTTTSAALFKQQLDPGLGIEVRLRKWY